MAVASRGLSRVVLAAALAAVRPAAALEAGGLPPPLPWQEPAPLARLFLQLPFESPEVAPPGSLELDARLLYSNSLLSGHDDQLTLEVDVETAQPTLGLRFGVAPGVEVQLAVPFVADYGGFLDQPIEVVEGWFGAENPQRRGRPRNAAHFQLTRADGSGILREDGGGGLGDVWAGVKVAVAGSPAKGGQLALRGAVKLPTGRLPYGSEEVDAGASLIAAWRWGVTAARLQVDAMVPTASLPAVHLRTRPYGALQVGVTHRLAEAVALQLQGSGHLSPLADTGLDQLYGKTAYVLAGATFALSRAADLDAAVVENVFSPYRGADITFLFQVRTALLSGEGRR